jgi:tripartite-type tricarboxylate transporter receptor subunit TctC
MILKMKTTARTRIVAMLAFIIVALTGGAAALAQDYPSRLVRIVVPFPAGGTLDVVARVLADQLAQQFGRPFIIDNRGGANGLIGTDAVAKSSPDGHTLLIVTASFVVNPSVHKKLPYSIERDFAPITDLGRSAGYLVLVPAALPVKTVKEFIAASRAPNARWHYGSPGFGNTLHLGPELFRVKTGAELQHVPYKGVAPAMQALLANEVQLTIMPPMIALEHVKAGALRALAFTGSTRWSPLPDVPTMAEAGFPDLTMEGAWLGMFAPSETPRPIVARIQAEVAKALAVPRVADTLINGGYDPAGATPEVFTTFVREETKRYAEIVKAAKIEPE